eukprot:TRINITY_DN30074_c0_g2_i1.p2 TRINITY_DN30074_c0_g2~~TRINITY_DN30074_c0_g2_i1.p2  ORF type:complete len:198 (+),score=29.96 TRINITY_DN30074_c0_g2_i1:98-691(+)
MKAIFVALFLEGLVVEVDILPELVALVVDAEEGSLLEVEALVAEEGSLLEIEALVAEEGRFPVVVVALLQRLMALFEAVIGLEELVAGDCRLYVLELYFGSYNPEALAYMLHIVSFQVYFQAEVVLSIYFDLEGQVLEDNSFLLGIQVDMADNQVDIFLYFSLFDNICWFDTSQCLWIYQLHNTNNNRRSNKQLESK